MAVPGTMRYNTISRGKRNAPIKIAERITRFATLSNIRAKKAFKSPARNQRSRVTGCLALLSTAKRRLDPSPAAFEYCLDRWRLEQNPHPDLDLAGIAGAALDCPVEVEHQIRHLRSMQVLAVEEIEDLDRGLERQPRDLEGFGNAQVE